MQPAVPPAAGGRRLPRLAHVSPARDALAAGGELWIVGNRHLGYHAKLKRLFRGVEQVAANPKFVILKAGK
ncbi:hypothetical protein CR64_37790 [Pseudomonas aeruginosa]|nr:hypothetical protein CR64_37790 [Pseudomonas aeruginosa]